MQNDIIPPERQANTKSANREPMRSLRLRGHSADEARQRLIGLEEQPTDIPKQLEYNENEKIEAEKVLNKKQPVAKKRFWHRWHDWSKKQKIIVLACAFVLVFGIATGAFLALREKPKPVVVKKAAPVVKADPKPTTVASPLSGLQVAPELAARPVTGIMIENSLSARPQSGLQDAGLIFEAIAEGGITRYMTLYQETSPQYVGPVRSLRPYYLDFAAPFEASIAHVGGSPEALQQVRSGMRDIDQFFNAGSYWRIRTRAAPHNMYTSFERLDALNQKKGFTSSKFTPWKRKADKPLATPTAPHIDVRLSSALYNVTFDYDKASNTYRRGLGGKPHIVTTSAEDKAGVQLSPKVVLTLTMSYRIITRAGHSAYGVTGSGQMYIFQDGGVTQGTWSKADRNSMFEFKDETGKPIELNAGQVWVSIVKAPSQVASSVPAP